MNLKLNKQVNKDAKNAKADEADESKVYEDTRDKLLSNLVQDMEDSSVNVDLEVDSESIEKSKKKYKQIFIKRTILYVAIIASFALIIVFGAYKTFFEHKYTGQEIAILSNYYNSKTNFPESGIQGYLNLNINVLLKEKLNIDSKVTQISVSQPVVTKINTKNDALANVYFYVNLTSNVGTTKVNAVLPISWDEKGQEYVVAGDVILTPNKPSNLETKKVKNNLLSFEDFTKENTDMTEASKVFINNFFTILYSGQDISPYYDGDTHLEVSDMKFDTMTGYTLYKETNLNGYNAYATINLIMPNGISYTTEKYLTIEKSGKSWIIKAVL